MLSSNSSCNQEPIPNYTPFPENDITSTFFPNSPHTHLEYQHFYLQYFHDLIYHHHSTTAVQETTPADSSENVVVKDHTAARNPCCKNGKASSKKDRHSKINTARGPRDRRMRLSLDIARKFFDLQDLLGYDKASRTVDWLLRNSGPAIKELARAQNPCSDQSSTCGEECNEGVSSVVPSKNSRARREKVKRVIGRATVGRESRRKARERARERTSQKRRLKNLTTEEPNGCEESLGLISSFKESHVAPLYDNMQQLQYSSPWNPSTVFNYQDENGVFLNDQDEPIAEFQFSGKPWETFNSFDLSG